MQLYLYVEKKNRNIWLLWAAYLAIGLTWVYMTVTFFQYGLNYIFQQCITLLYTLVILLVCVTYDKEIVHFSEHSGFISYSSRKLKFYILFTVVIAIIFASMIISGMGDAWSNDL